jgi:hypothetical protein
MNHLNSSFLAITKKNLVLDDNSKYLIFSSSNLKKKKFVPQYVKTFKPRKGIPKDENEYDIVWWVKPNFNSSCIDCNWSYLCDDCSYLYEFI